MDSRSGAQRRRQQIVVQGPLGAFTDGLRRHLADQGYALDSVVDHVHLLADLSDWLSGRDLTAADLTSVMAEEFLRERRGGPADRGHTSRARAGFGVSASPAGRAAFDGCWSGDPGGTRSGRVQELPGR